MHTIEVVEAWVARVHLAVEDALGHDDAEEALLGGVPLELGMAWLVVRDGRVRATA